MIIRVFGGSFGASEEDIQLAYELGKRIGLKGHTLKNGGYNGTMEASAKGCREQGGKVIGVCVFMRETGFSEHYWKGKYWRSWSAFQADAGYTPNSPNEKIADEVLLHRFAHCQDQRHIGKEPRPVARHDNEF